MSFTSSDLGQVYEECKSTADCQTVIEKVEQAVMMHTQSSITDFDPEALKHDIQQYKQLVWNLKDENNLLKVKLRRLEDIVKKKPKIVDTHYLGTHNKLLVKEAIHQVSHRIESLQNDNQDLRQEMMTKDQIIKKLRRKIESYSAYKPIPGRKKSCPASASSRTSRNTDNAETASSADPNTDDHTSDEMHEEILEKMKAFSLSQNNNEAEVKTTRWVSDNDAAEASTERAVSCTLLLDSPHEEIEKLHTGFKDILTEVGKLKSSVSQIHDEHARTVCEMRIREKVLMSNLYDKQAELAYRKSPKTTATLVANTVATSEKMQPMNRAPTKRQKTKPTTAFVRIATARKVDKPSPKRKGKGLGIRTASRNSLHDETDMRLYIDEVLHEMNQK